MSATVLGVETRRIHTLDGFRAILALSVLANHALLTQARARHLDWDLVATNFENQLGSCAVAFFFMISAYLFAGGLIKNHGSLNVFRLFEGRVMRIVPLYLVCVALLLVFVGYETRFQLTVRPATLLAQIGRWMVFGFREGGPVNGLQEAPWLMGQIWTLKFEWLLYLALPFLAWFQRRTSSPAAVYLGLLACCFKWSFFAFFLAGTSATQLAKLHSRRFRVAWQAGGIVGLLVVVFALRGSYGWLAAILLTPFFIAVLQGEGWSRLLELRTFRYLGEISYSIYMLHPFVIWALSRWILSLPAYAKLGPLGLGLSIVAIAVTTAFVASLSFWFIEKPLMKLRPLTGAGGHSPR